MKKLARIMLGALVAFTAFNFSGCSKYDDYDHANLYSIGEFSYATTDVNRIEIDWVAGSVEIEQSASATLLVSEDAASLKNAEKMHYYIEGGVLKIKYCESNYKGKIDATNKHLRVEIPEGISLEIDTVSAPITMGGVSLASLSLETVSGNVTAETWNCTGSVEVDTVSGSFTIGELTAENFESESTSGNINISKLSVNRLDAESTSGNIILGLNKKTNADIETTSGDITLSLLTDDGARVKFKSVSGDFKAEKEYTKSALGYDFFGADGVSTGSSIAVETVSGDLLVK